MQKIIKNAIKCNHCGDIIESTNTRVYVACSCGRCIVDGGHYYLRRGFKDLDDFKELSEIEEIGE